MMSKNPITIIARILVFIAVGYFIALAFNIQIPTDPAGTNSINIPQETRPETLIITYQGEDGKTVMELLKENYAEVVTQKSEFGEYVDSIDGIKGGTDGKYWLFYVNDQPATIGADVYETTSEDTIEWRFE